MSVERLLNQFNLTLSQDVLKELQLAGTPFSKEIWGQATVGDRVGCIILDKSEQDEVRVKFNVYNKDSEDGESKNSQTDHSGAIPKRSETSEISVQAQQETHAKNSQTEKKEQSEQHQQTDVSKNNLNESFMQTDELEQFDQISQTEQNSLTESFIQTEAPEIVEQCLQTESPKLDHTGTQVVCQTSCTQSQTEIKHFQESHSQTELEYCEQISQTDTALISDSAIQASVEMIENNSQTEIKEYADSDMQTELEVTQKGVQTIQPQVKEHSVSTDPMIVINPEDQIEMDAQTDTMRVTDPSLDREVQTQTEYGKVIYPEIMFDNVCQTDDVKIVTLESQTEGCSQTDYVFITQPEDLLENVVQTDDVTILNPDTQISQETQTNLVWVVGLQQDENAHQEGETHEITPTSHDNVEQPASDPPQDQPGMMAPSLDMSVQQIPDEMSSNKVMVDNEEKWVQTDPVTIIIGDSSFLLQQLANINKSPEATPQQVPARRKAGRPTGNNSIYNRNRQENPPMLERHGLDGSLQMVQESTATDGILTNEMPTLEAENGQVRRGVKMLLPKQKSPYRGPYSVSGMKPANQQQVQQEATSVGQVLESSQPNIQEINAVPVRIEQEYQEQMQAGYVTEQQQPAGLEDPSSKGKFNCPFCPATFDDTPALYKHIHEDHGTPRCSTRKARRKGTIIVDDDGSMHIVGEQNTLWELNEENMRRYRRAKRYSPRSSRYTPRTTANPKEEAGGIFREDEDQVQLAHAMIGDASGIVAVPGSTEEGEITLQIVQNGSNAQPVVRQPDPVQIPEVVPAEKSFPDPTAESPDVGKRAFNCPRCPKLFTKSSELYIHLQSSHKAANSNRGRGRGRGAYHQLQIVDATDLQDQELVEGEPPSIIQLQQAQPDLTGEMSEETCGEEEREVQIHVEYRDDTDQGQLEVPQEEPQIPIVNTDEGQEEIPQPENTEEEGIPAVKVSRRGRPRVKKEKDEDELQPEVRSPRGGKRKVDETPGPEPEEEQRRRGRSAAAVESPPKRNIGRPPAKRGRKH